MQKVRSAWITCGYWSTGEGEGKPAPSPEPHHGLTKINTSVKMCFLTGRVLPAHGKREAEGEEKDGRFTSILLQTC